MATNRTAGLQRRGGSRALQGRVCWPGSPVAKPSLLMFLTGAGDGTWCRELRRAGTTVDELRYAAPDPATAMRVRAGRRLLTDLGAALNAPGAHQDHATNRGGTERQVSR